MHRRRPGFVVAAAALSAGLLVSGTASQAAAGQTEQQTAQAASLLVDTSQPVQDIDPQLFGSNVAWNAEFDFLKPGSTQYYPKFLRQVRSAGFSAERFPGGTLGSTYDWERAIGPLAGRQPNMFFEGDGPEPSLLGPDEYGKLLATSGAVGDVIVNPSTGTLAQARDFVAYMTLPAPHVAVTDPSDPRYWAGLRARYGHPQPYNVPWWEVGNEINTAGNAGWMGGALVSYANPDCAATNVRACLYDFGGTTSFQDQPAAEFADTRPSASLSTGAAGQQKYVAYPPVAPGTLTLQVAGQTWTQVADLAQAGPADTVFALDAGTGMITFGNGIHGAIPPAGAPVTVSYDSGPHPGFVDFYQAMRAVNPAIHVCLGDSSYPAGVAYLQDLGSTHPYDCVPTHPYVRDGTSTAAGDIPNDLSEAQYDLQLLALPDVLAGQVQQIRQQIDQYAGSRAADVSIPVTEFGQLQSSVPDFAPEFHSTLQEGILIAGQLREWIDLGLPLAEHYLLTGSPFGSTSSDPGVNVNTNAEIAGPGPDPVEEPTALVEQLFRPLGGQQQLAVQADSVPSLHLPDGSTVPALLTIAGRHGNTLNLVIINQSPDTDLPATVTASSARIVHGSVSTLDAVSALSYNTAQDPDAVAIHTRPAGPAAGGGLTLTLPAHSVSLVQLTLNDPPTR
jgi:alpha-N-arabinofuranosidase